MRRSRSVSLGADRLALRRPLQGEPIRPEFSVTKQEFDTARRLKLPITVHVSGTTAKRQFDSLAGGNFLGPDVHLAHFSNASPAHLKLAVDAGSPVSLTPMTELRVGYGVTQLGDYLTAGMKVGFGIDSNSLAGVSDMFTVMKMFQNIEAGRTKNELAVAPRKLLQLATIEGARSIGLDSQIGSLTPGKRADVILVNTRALNLAVLAPRCRSTPSKLRKFLATRALSKHKSSLRRRQSLMSRRTGFIMLILW